MLLDFNLLPWSTHITEGHFPVLVEIKKAGYDGVELPIYIISYTIYTQLKSYLTR